MEKGPIKPCHRSATPPIRLTLPTDVAFAHWVNRSGASVSNDEITRSDILTAGEAITFTFEATNTVRGGTVVPNTVQFSGTFQSGCYQVVYTATNTCAPDVSGNWLTIFASCPVGSKIVIPAGITVMWDSDISLSGDLEIEAGGALDATTFTYRRRLPRSRRFGFFPRSD